MDLRDVSRALSRQVNRLSFDTQAVDCVYNPLDYAIAPHTQYLERYGTGPKKVLLIGMNPGPWGMVQTGIPFGDVSMVKEWLGIEAPVRTPKHMHPKRPVMGFACTRSEVSGHRLWSWAKTRFGTPQHFFSQFFVHNYCPLAFMEVSGKNLTPDKLSPASTQTLFKCCDQALLDVVHLLKPEHVIGVGAFAEKRARLALKGIPLRIGRILHPSPASPLANANWAETVDHQLANQLG